MAQTHDETLKAIIERLFQERGIDFRDYKPTTLRRRVQRRVDDTGCSDMPAYLDLLTKQPEEYSKLINTLLINVTEFFREPEAWEFLRTEVVPRILDSKQPGDQIKVWSVGCATGEEAYGLAMVFADAVGSQGRTGEVKVYATDIDEDALAIARRGHYDDAAVERVPEDLRKKYMSKDGIWTVKRGVRKMVIFGNHSLVTDAPISHCDLIVCRNVLIYMSASLQDRVLSKFHYALESPGFLFLGKAEAMLARSRQFSSVNDRARIYVKEAPGGAAAQAMVEQQALGTAVDLGAAEYEVISVFNQAVLRQASVAVIALDGNNVVRVMNPAAERIWGARASDMLGRSIVELPLPPPLQDLVGKAIQVRRDRKEFTIGELCISSEPEKELYAAVRVTPMFDVRGGAEGVIILAEDITEQVFLRRQLEAANEALHTVNEELETTNEELQSTNEELMTTNEELQSTNEELETTNEELQSTNEELETTNDELEARTAELHRTAEEREKAQELLQLVNDLAADSLAGASLEHSLATMLSTAQANIGAEAGSVEVYDEPDILRAWVFETGGEECKMERGFGRGDRFPGLNARYRGRSVVDNDFAESALPVGHMRLRNLLSVGVEVRGGWAHLALANKEGGFDEEDVRKAELLARFANLIIDRATLDASEKAAWGEAETRAGELQEAKAWLEAVLDTVPAGVIVSAKPDGHVTLVNPMASELYGAPIEVGNTIRNAMALTTTSTPEGRALRPDEAPIKRAFLLGETVRDEEIVVHLRDGRLNTLLMNAAPMLDVNGQVTAAIAGFLDISAIKDTQNELKAAYEHDHRIAETLQKALLPALSDRVGELAVRVRYQAAWEEAEVGGDFYQSTKLPDDKFLIALGDVSGKGLEAAVFSAMAKYMLSAFAAETPDPPSLLRRLNEALSTYLDDGVFITLAYALVDLKSYRVRLGSAGHEPSIHFSRSTGKTTMLPSTGSALGISAAGEYTSHEFTLEEGDILLLYTDGLSEAGYSDKPLQAEGIAAIVAAQSSKEPDKILDTLYKTATRIAGGKLTDDAASVLIRRVAGV